MSNTRDDTTDEKDRPASHSGYTERAKPLVHPDNIKAIRAALICHPTFDGWTVDAMKKEEGKIPIQTVRDHDGKPRFDIHVDKLTTNQVNLKTFIATLISFQAIFPGNSPEITM